MDQDATWYAGRPRPRPHCVRWDPVLPNKRSAAAPLLAHVYCGQTARRIKISLGTELGLGHRPHFLRQRPNSPTERGTAPPTFGPCLLWPNGRPSQQLMSSCSFSFVQYTKLQSASQPMHSASFPLSVLYISENKYRRTLLICMFAMTCLC